MKKQSKLSILITLSLVTLIATIGLANAQPIPIGATTWQPNPFESNPSVATDNTMYGFTDAAKMWDGRFTTGPAYFQVADNDADTWVEISAFDMPPFSTITWVDIKINYYVDPLFDDTWRFEYAVGGSGYTTIEPDRTGQFDVDSAAAQTVAYTQLAEPIDGTWSQADVVDLKFRIWTTPGTDGMSDWWLMYINEVWATVYSSPLPLAGGGGGGGTVGMSIQPTNVLVSPVMANRRFFIDIYVQGVTALSGYQFTVNFDTTYLNPLVGGWSYYPFNFKAAEDLNDALGYVTMAYVIPTADPLVSAGVSGNFPIARIYFTTVTGIPADWFSWLTFSVTLMSAPGAVRIVHMEYDGLYGTAPPGSFLLSWVNTSPFPYTSPITTEWIEVYPDAGVRHHFSSWFDNEPGVDILDPSDQFDMTPIDPPGPTRNYHLDEILEVNADPNINIHMIATIKDIPEFPLGIGLLMAIAPMIAIVYVWRLRKRSK